MPLFKKSDGVLKRLRQQKKKLQSYHSAVLKFYKDVSDVASTRENAVEQAIQRACQRVRGIYKRGVLDAMQHAYHVGCLEVQRAKTVQVLDAVCSSLLAKKAEETKFHINTMEGLIEHRKADKSADPGIPFDTDAFCVPPKDVIGKNIKVSGLRAAVHKLTKQLDGAMENMELIKPFLALLPRRDRLERLRCLISEEAKEPKGLEDTLVVILDRVNAGASMFTLSIVQVTQAMRVLDAETVKELFGLERWRQCQLRRSEFAGLLTDQRFKEGRILHRWCDEMLGEGKDDYVFGSSMDFNQLQAVIGSSSKDSLATSPRGRRSSRMHSPSYASPARVPIMLKPQRSNTGDKRMPPPPVVLDFIGQFTGLVARSVNIRSWTNADTWEDTYDAVRSLVSSTLYPRLQAAFFRHLKDIPQVVKRDERWRERCHLVAQLSAREQEIDEKILGPLRLPAKDPGTTKGASASAAAQSTLSNALSAALRGAWSQALEAFESAQHCDEPDKEGEPGPGKGRKDLVTPAQDQCGEGNPTSPKRETSSQEDMTEVQRIKGQQQESSVSAPSTPSNNEVKSTEELDADPSGLFAASISLLNAIESCEVPEDMVDLLMSAIRCAAEEVDYRSPKGKTVALDADTLTPILVYIVCRCGWENPHATLAYLAHFGVTGMGEEAYYVTSIAQAVGHICSMKPSRLKRRASSTVKQLFSDSEDEAIRRRPSQQELGYEDSRNFIFTILQGGDEEGKSHDGRGSALARSLSQRSGLTANTPVGGDVAVEPSPGGSLAEVKEDSYEESSEEEDIDSFEDDDVFDVSLVLRDKHRDEAAQREQHKFLTREMAMERLVAAFY